MPSWASNMGKRFASFIRRRSTSETSIWFIILGLVFVAIIVWNWKNQAWSVLAIPRKSKNDKDFFDCRRHFPRRNSISSCFQEQHELVKPIVPLTVTSLPLHVTTMHFVSSVVSMQELAHVWTSSWLYVILITRTSVSFLGCMWWCYSVT